MEVLARKTQGATAVAGRVQEVAVVVWEEGYLRVFLFSFFTCFDFLIGI
jgi:hypothetical protein